MSQDCFSERETDSARLSSNRQAKSLAAIPEKPDIDVLVKKVLSAYGTHPAEPDIYSAPASGDPVLFKIAARSLQQPIWAFCNPADLEIVNIRRTRARRKKVTLLSRDSGTEAATLPTRKLPRRRASKQDKALAKLDELFQRAWKETYESRKRRLD